jgi:hypothetical protein
MSISIAANFVVRSPSDVLHDGKRIDRGFRLSRPTEWRNLSVQSAAIRRMPDEICFKLQGTKKRGL